MIDDEIKKIENNEDLTPEKKQQAIFQLSMRFYAPIENFIKNNLEENLGIKDFGKDFSKTWNEVFKRCKDAYMSKLWREIKAKEYELK